MAQSDDLVECARCAVFLLGTPKSIAPGAYSGPAINPKRINQAV